MNFTMTFCHRRRSRLTRGVAPGPILDAHEPSRAAPNYGLYATKCGECPRSLAGWVSLPGYAAVQQQPQAVVGEVAEAAPDALDLPTIGGSRAARAAGAMEFGPHPTDLTADDSGRGGLYLELPLAAYHLRGGDLEAVQDEQPGGRDTTVLIYLGPPVLPTSDIRKLCQPQVLFRPLYVTASRAPPHAS